MNKTRFPSIFIITPAWQAHANLSMISECTNNCGGQGNAALLSTLPGWLYAGRNSRFLELRLWDTLFNIFDHISNIVCGARPDIVVQHDDA